MHNSSSYTDKFVKSKDQLATNVRDGIDRLIMITAVFACECKSLQFKTNHKCRGGLQFAKILYDTKQSVRKRKPFSYLSLGSKPFSGLYLPFVANCSYGVSQKGKYSVLLAFRLSKNVMN